MPRGNHLGRNWTREEDEIIWDHAFFAFAQLGKLVTALKQAGFDRTPDAIRDRLRRIRHSKETNTPLRYFGDSNKAANPGLSDIERLARHKSWRAAMPAKPKMVLIYQVYDKDDPSFTDCFFATAEEAEEFRKGLTNPCEVILHRMGTTKADICHALSLYPRRGGAS
jgi:hypothetical protein